MVNVLLRTLGDGELKASRRDIYTCCWIAFTHSTFQTCAVAMQFRVWLFGVAIGCPKAGLGKAMEPISANAEDHAVHSSGRLPIAGCGEGNSSRDTK